MADQESTEFTSTNEEAQDQELSLDSISFDDDGDESTESETTENDADTEQHDEAEESEEDEATEETGESDESDETEEQEEAELSEEEKRKAFNREMAQRRIEAKKQREQTQEEAQQDYLQQAEDEKDLALRQLQVDAYNNNVEKHTNRLTNDYERAVKDFEILNDENPLIQAEVAAALDAFQAMHMTIDQYGNPAQVNGDLYEHLQKKAESLQSITGLGARKQVQAKAKQKSRTFQTPNRSPEKSKDPLMDVLLAD